LVAGGSGRNPEPVTVIRSPLGFRVVFDRVTVGVTGSSANAAVGASAIPLAASSTAVPVASREENFFRRLFCAVITRALLFSRGSAAAEGMRVIAHRIELRHA